MGKVLEFDNRKDVTPSFSLSARMEANGNWSVAITDFYDDRMEAHEVYREIAEVLIPIAGGLVHGAEELEPTARGCIISNITLYSNGNIDFHSQPLDTDVRRKWFVAAMNKVKRSVLKTGRAGNGLDK